MIPLFRGKLERIRAHTLKPVLDAHVETLCRETDQPHQGQERIVVLGPALVATPEVFSSTHRPQRTVHPRSVIQPLHVHTIDPWSPVNPNALATALCSIVPRPPTAGSALISFRSRCASCNPSTIPSGAPKSSRGWRPERAR